MKRKAKQRDEESSADEVEEEQPQTKARRSTRRTAKAEAAAVEEDAASIKGEWTKEDSLLIFTPEDIVHSNKIASFDFDSTLVNTKSKRKFATGPNDWELFSPKVATKCKELAAQGYKLVIFSNQGGVGEGKISADSVKKRVLGAMDAIGVPMQVFLATMKDGHRKPGIDMFNVLEESYNDGIDIDRAASFYCGDAAGRPATTTRKKDFACSDRKFALNVGMKFHTPEHLFLGEKELPFELGVQPHQLAEQLDEKALNLYKNIASKKQELVIFVGFPASGKSTFAKTHLVPKGYVHVNQDTLKTAAKCLKVCREALEEGKSVVIDNTNPGSAVRASYIDAAQDNGVENIRCFHFDVNIEVAKHMNLYREKITDGEHKHVPDIGYNMFKKKYEEPTEDEGFTEIVKIKFVPQFESEEAKNVFKLYT